MRPVSELTANDCRRIQTVFTDIDDTLSSHGQIPSRAYDALWRLHDAGIRVVPVTGRPAGWCDMVARMWPVDAVVGENGALAYGMVSQKHGAPPVMKKIYAERPADAQKRLEAIANEVLRKVPGTAIASDQAFRMYDLAIDFCEEVEPLSDIDVNRIVEVFEAHGATAKVSSIHVNGWYGEFDKLTMCQRAHQFFWGTELNPATATFVGDSPNDEPNFAFFNVSIGVANVGQFTHRMTSLPTHITTAEGGEGFAEFTDILLTQRNAP